MKYEVRMVSVQINREDKLILKKSNKRRLPFSKTELQKELLITS